MRPEVDWLSCSAAAAPNRPALSHEGTSLERGDLDRRAWHLASGLARLGLPAQTPVALLAGSGLDMATAVHALPRSGAILVPLGVRLIATELEHQIRATGAPLLIHDAQHAGTAHAISRATGCTSLLLEELLEEPLEEPLELANGAVGRPSPLPRVHSLVLTSGTSGAPKGVPLTRANHLHCALAAQSRLGLGAHDHWLACMPLSHVGGLAILLRAAILGLKVTLTSRFDPAECLDLLERHRITLISLVPTMLADLLDAACDRPPPPALRCVLLGGARAGADLLNRAAAATWPVATTYGLTEAASQVATRPPAGPDGRPPRPGEAGPPLDGIEVRITDGEGRELRPGEEGEILIRGPSVTGLTLADGQIQQRRGDRRGPAGECWLATGDLGRLDASGTVWVEDRREDRIVSGGENIAPAEIEAVLEQHPGVADVCVVACPDPRWGQVPAAFVVPAPGSTLDDRDLTGTETPAASSQLQDSCQLQGSSQLQDYCRERLAGFKVPRQIRFLPSIPRTASGKPLRAALRAALVADGHGT